MLTQRQLEQIAAEFGKRMEKIVQQYLQAMGEHIRDIGKLLPSDVQKLVEMKRMGVNVDAIKVEIAAAMEAAARDVERVFYETAETDYRAAQALFGEARSAPLRKNAALVRTLKAYTRQTAATLANLSNTTVVSTAYRAAIDRAVQAAQSGVTDYAAAVRQALKEAAVDGLRVQYASGATRRLDSAVRMNVLDGIRQLNQDIAMQTGREYGADGVELSAHRLCAEDHLPYQGRQFSLKEYERLQALLKRPIGVWNCRHFAFPIILGVSEPAHSPELLENYRRSSQERITIDGVTKTRYEWTQQQRKLETAVRRQKDVANTAKAAGDDVLRREAQYNIERYQAAYDRITDKAMLTADRSRMRVDRPSNALKNGGRRAILSTSTMDGGGGVRVIGEITNEQVTKYWKGAKTRVILTEERIGHIREGHADDFDAFSNYIPDAIRDPAYVLCDVKNENTAMFIRHVKQTNINVIVKLAFEEMDSDLESSVITMYRLGEKTLRRLIKKNPVVYSRDET